MLARRVEYFWLAQRTRKGRAARISSRYQNSHSLSRLLYRYCASNFNTVKTEFLSEVKNMAFDLEYISGTFWV